MPQRRSVSPRTPNGHPASFWDALGTRAPRRVSINRTLNTNMRYHDLREARPWKLYEGRKRSCVIARMGTDGASGVHEVEASSGIVMTGRTEVFFGYFVLIHGPAGEEWLGEDRRSIVAALRAASDAARAKGWTVLAVSLDDGWEESGLSANSGFGYHPAFDRAVHMLEPLPQDV